MNLTYNEIRDPKYGPTIFVQNDAPEPPVEAPVPAWKEQVDLAVELVGEKGVAELERLTTAIFLLKKEDSRADEELASMMHRLKPHISEDDALTTLRKARSLLS
jgi:hypothetical protein